MTRIFDAQSYADLLVRYQPKPIETEAENEGAIALAQELEHRTQRTAEEGLFLELLLTLIEKYEPLSMDSLTTLAKSRWEIRLILKCYLVHLRMLDNSRK